MPASSKCPLMSSLNPNTAAHAVISLCTSTGTLRTSCAYDRPKGRPRARRATHILYPLYRARLDNGQLVLLARSGQVAQSRDGVTLDLLLIVREQVHERFEEAALDDGRLVGGMNRDVANAGGGGEDEGEEGGFDEAAEGRKAVILDNLDLVLL